MGDKYNDEKKKLIEEYIETGKQEDKADKEAKDAKNDNDDASPEGIDPENYEDDNEGNEGDVDPNNEQDREDEQGNEDEQDSEDEQDREDEQDNEDEQDDEDEKDDENEKDNENEKDKSKNEDGNSEDKVDSESRRKLGPNNEDRKVNLDNYKKPPSMADKGTDYLKGKAGNAKSDLIKNVQRVQAAVSAAFSTVKGTVVGAVKLLVNPIFWIVLGISSLIALVFFLVASTSAVFGGNDYNKLCDQGGIAGAGGVVIGDDVDDLTRQSAIASWLMSTPFEAFGGQPMSREQAVAVIGNLKLESFMANPKAIGGKNDWNVELWKQCDNHCVKNNTMGSNPVGLLQHLDGRRDHLVSMAEAEGVQWYDLNIQLKHLKAELDGEGQPSNPKYEMKQAQLNFTKPGLTIEEYTWYWQKDYERAGESKDSSEMALRQKYAKEFDEQFTGASAALSTQCFGGLATSSNVTELAAQIAWTREEKAAGKGYGNCGAKPGCGENFSKSEYIELKARVEEETGRNGGNIRGLLASCDALVATLVRGSGIDTNIPYHNSNAQIDYMNNPKNGWEKVSCQSRQPGDVFGKYGHIMIYVGEIDGKDTMVSASLNVGSSEGRSAHMSNISCNGEMFYGDGMTAQGWRKVK